MWFGLTCIGFCFSENSFGEEKKQSAVVEEVIVISKQEAYGNISLTQEAIAKTSSAASVVDVLKGVPGVLVNEGDAFGSDDWTTTIFMRGFQSSLDAQQLGMTIDGIPNGNSNYGGGSKANRFIDTANLETVEVSQGISNIASRSREALGGTLNFATQNPLSNQRLQVSGITGNFNAQKLYSRFDTGEILSDTFAWVSVSHSSIDTWIQSSGTSTRDHAAAKLQSTFDNIKITSYLSYDDAFEANYNQIELAEFNEDPHWDRLTAHWVGIPFVDQNYRKVWSTLRTNTLAYFKADVVLDDVNITSNIYYHHNKGRGDWAPPYLVNIVDDGAGVKNSELSSGHTAIGGTSLGKMMYVNANGIALSPAAGCESSLVFPYESSADYDPSCYDENALPVSSFRHTHYDKPRMGANIDLDWQQEWSNGQNNLRTGFWYEQATRSELRDWHRIIDATKGFKYDAVPYWKQYSLELPTTTLMFYVEDSLKLGALTARAGIKQFKVDLERKDLFDGDKTHLNSNSEPLLNAGLVYDTPIKGLQMFGGYAESFSAVQDDVLEAGGGSLDRIKPELAKTTDLGARFSNGFISANLTLYHIDFNNHVTYIPESTSSEINYLNESAGKYLNVGGLESQGVEFGASAFINDAWSISGSYTLNDSTYLGTGDTQLDENLGVFPRKTVYGSAQKMFSLACDWRYQNYSAGLMFNHVGKRWMDAENTQELPAYNLVDFDLEIDLKSIVKGIDDTKLQINISNLLNESYLGATVGGWWAAIGAPRAVTATLTFNL